MSVKRSIEGKIVTWEYEQFCSHGIVGRLDMELEELNKLYSDNTIEFAPVKKEVGRDFLAAFCFEPAVDVTLVRAWNGEASIVTYSLNKNGSKQLMKDIVNKSQFSVYEPDQDFIRTIEGEIKLLETQNYNLCKLIAEMLNEDLEKVVGAVRYSNFISRYKGFSEPKSMRVAIEKFKLPRDKFNLF
jgi:hypothetical protein